MTNLQIEIDKIKRDRIADLKLTISVCEHAVAFEPLTLQCQELMTNHIRYCEKMIQIYQNDLDNNLSDTLYAICNPNLYAHV